MPFVCLKFASSKANLRTAPEYGCGCSSGSQHQLHIRHVWHQELLHLLEQPANFTEDQKNLSFNSRYASLTVNLKATQVVFGNDIKTQVLAVDPLTCIDHIPGQD